MDIEQFRVAGYAAIDAICARFYALESQKVAPSHGLKPGYLRNMIPGQSWTHILAHSLTETQIPPPTSAKASRTLPTILKTSFFQVKYAAPSHKLSFPPGITNWAHPSFFAYFPTANTFEGILGDLYASSISNPGFNVESTIPSPSLGLTLIVVIEPCVYRARNHRHGLGSTPSWFV